MLGLEGQEPGRRGQRCQMILPLRQGGGKKKDQEIAGWGASVREQARGGQRILGEYLEVVVEEPRDWRVGGLEFDISEEMQL